MTPEEEAVALLIQKNYTITTAESCTGGMIASTLINVPGVSQVYKEGYITYANEAKEKLLGVSKELLVAKGAVSKEVAYSMAKGAAKAAGAEAALAVTGIAGPCGGTREKPVGLVYIGCCVKGRVTVTENRLQGDRMSIRQETVQRALQLLLQCLNEEKRLSPVL